MEALGLQVFGVWRYRGLWHEMFGATGLDHGLEVLEVLGTGGLGDWGLEVWGMLGRDVWGHRT